MITKTTTITPTRTRHDGELGGGGDNYYHYRGLVNCRCLRGEENYDDGG